jgi:Tol biopolymer transport system component/DNA-binding winged helix-turn-helix (wHTH) protein
LGPPQATTDKIRFGVFELDPAAGELRKQGVRIKLQAQPLQVLFLLLENPGNVISREQIRQALWPVDTYVDFDRSLNTAINKLREALGDSAQAPRFIETVPRRGYRFVAPVERADKTTRKTAKISSWLFPGITVASTALVAGALLWQWRPAPDQRPAEPRPLTSYPGSESQASFSPDGGQFAFVWNGADERNFDIYVQAIGAERPLQLTTDPAPDFSPAWSPTGEMIAFIRTEEGGTARVLVIPATGGSERQITRIRIHSMHYLPTELAWLPDGQSLIVPGEQGSGETALFLWSLNTGQKRQLTFPPTGSPGDRFPSVSPDGRLLLFSRGPVSNARLYQARLDSSRDATEVNAGALEPKMGTWSGYGRDIVAVAGAQHWSGLWLIPSNSRRAPSQFSRYPAGAPASSSSGRRLAYTVFNWDANIWQLSITPGRVSAGPLIASTYVDHFPDISPDGGRVAFVSSRSGTQQLYVFERSGGGLLKLTSGGAAIAPRWSPKGDRLAYHALTDNRQNDIYLINSDATGLERLTHDAADDITPSWSVNGWIYFASNRAGPYDIWKMRPNGAEPQRITRGGGKRPIPSGDGHYVYYAKDEEETSLWRVGVDGLEQMVLPSLSTAANFAIVDDRIIFIPGLDAALRSTIECFQPATGKKEVLMRLERRPLWGLAARADAVLFSQADRDSSDLMIIDPFSAP